MQIFQVAHGFPPDQMAGAEVYAWKISREMARRSHAVHVLAPTRRENRESDELIEEDLDGVRVFRLNRNAGRARRLEETYRDPVADGIFRDLLLRLRPDVVHVHHTIDLSIGVTALARAAHIPLVFTLHDFWYQCPRGQRITPRGHLCTKVQPWRCAMCIAPSRIAYGGRFLAEQASASGESPVGRVLRFPGRMVRYAREEALRAPILRRRSAMGEMLLDADLLLAPSQFLLERFVEQGVPPERLELNEYGMDDTPFRALPPRGERNPSARPVRFGFVGSLIRSKGADLLIRAFQNMPVDEATLELFDAGNVPGAERYGVWVRSLNRHPGLVFRGRFDNARVAQIFSDLDVLVVPSRWWENAPLTIHEAAMAGLPVVTADHGGMLELARRFGHAALFRVDDVADLERAMRRFLEEPDIWSALRPTRSVRTVSEDVDGLLERYASLARRPRA